MTSTRESLPDPVRGVLFDFDQTLADLGSHVRWDDAGRELASHYEASGVPRELLGGRAISLYARVAASGLLPDAAFEAAQREASAILERYEREAIASTELFSCVRGCLGALEQAGIAAGVVSSNSRAVVRSILERDGLASHFATVVCRDDVRLPKPSPEGLLLACGRLGVRPGDVLYIGDNVADVAAALAAGIVPCGVRGGDSSEAALAERGAAIVLDDVGELLTDALPPVRTRGAP